MRARNLKPGIFKNEVLAKLGAHHFILFEGLWCLADREGRLEDRPERIEAEIFPFKWQKVNVESMLQDLAQADPAFIIRYTRDENRYIQVVAFKAHQRPHVNEAESFIPPAPKTISTTKDTSEHNQGDAHLSPRRPESLSSESLSSESPSLNPESIPRGAFDQIWALYPRKVGKDSAARHFKAQVKTMKDWLDIQNSLANFKAQLAKDKTEERYIPHGSTWFNGRWHDTIAYSGGSGTQGMSDFERHVREVNGIPIPGAEENHAPHGSESTDHDERVPQRPRYSPGLRKAGLVGPAGALLHRIRTGTADETPAPKPDRGSGGTDGKPVE